MASNFCDLIRSYAELVCSRGVVRLKDKKSVGARSDSIAQTSEARVDESDSHTIAYPFAQTKESFTNSLANAYAEEQIKAEKSKSDANTRTRRNPN
jgi:hypothetical protein